jgi:hypothetical protein
MSMRAHRQFGVGAMILVLALVPLACKRGGPESKPSQEGTTKEGQTTPVTVVPAPANAQGPAGGGSTPVQPDDVEVLARGPLHEAYAQPVNSRPGPGAIIPKQPPGQVTELPPDQKPEGAVVWIPGYWAWDGDRSDFIWISGFWRVPPEGQRWLQGHWQEVDGGWIWVAGFWISEAVAQVQYLPPPPPPLDEEPPTPATEENSTFVPGCWVYQEMVYKWRPGHWVPFRSGRIWVPARYVWTTIGFIFLEGYWDRPLDECGIVFAPVYFGRDWWAKSDHRFCPQLIVNCDFLIGALFIGPDGIHFFFGDYFDDLHAGQGYGMWPDVMRKRGAYDPNFDYYRRLHSSDPQWEKDLRELYRGRTAGDVPRPPHSFNEQLRAIKSIADAKSEKVAVNKNVPLTHLQNVSALAPIGAVHNTPKSSHGSTGAKKAPPETRPVIKIEPVSPVDRDSHRKTAEHVGQTAKQRGEIEDAALQAGNNPVRHSDPVKEPVKLPPPPPPPPPSPEPPPPSPPPPPVPPTPPAENRPIPQHEPQKPVSPKKK